MKRQLEVKYSQGKFTAQSTSSESNERDDASNGHKKAHPNAHKAISTTCNSSSAGGRTTAGCLDWHLLQQRSRALQWAQIQAVNWCSIQYFLI